MKKLLALVVLAPLAAVADRHHAPEFQSLIDEPANMLDIAMLRLSDFIFWTKPNMALEYEIAANADSRNYVDINAEYLAGEGVIHVSALLTDLQSTRGQMEAGCRRVLHIMRINISKGLGEWFSHIDGSFLPSSNGEPANLFGMIELSCHVYGRGTTDRRFGAAIALGPDAEMEILPVD